MNEAKGDSDCLGGVWVGIYAKTGSKLAAETFSLRIFFTSSQFMRGITLSSGGGESSELSTSIGQSGATSFFV